jgi:ATP-dependent RNA helicase DDX10/DBP4
VYSSRSLSFCDSFQTSKAAKTKYDRMFARKSQTILSDHYNKVVDHDGEDDRSGLLGPAGGDDDEDDFITIKRHDHELNERELPSSSFLSKRKLKQGMSKKAMLSTKGNPTKLTFDDEGGAHAVYELGDEEDFARLGDAAELRKQFVEKEGEELAKQDVLDKQRVKEKRLEKKRKRKEIEREVSTLWSSFPRSTLYGLSLIRGHTFFAAGPWSRRKRRRQL